jgi:predicted nucleic-acid-binding protein
LNALDTSVLARFFVDDDEDDQAAIQRPAAVDALSQRGFVTVTVLLEFEWVMRGFYRLSRGQVAQVVSALAAIEHITLEDRAAVLTALDGYASGLDFADALHLARSERATAFLTFDRKLARRAVAAGFGPPVNLLA